MDEKLGVQAKTNAIDNFKYGFDDVFIDKLVDRMDQNQDIFNKIMDDKTFAAVVKDYLLKRVKWGQRKWGQNYFLRGNSGDTVLNYSLFCST